MSGLGGRRSHPIEFTIRGADWSKLVELSERITGEMEKTGLMTDVDTNYQDGMPEVQIVPDRIKARQYAVDVAEISQAVNVMMAGSIAGKYAQGGRRYDVRVGLPASSRISTESLKGLKIRNSQGELIALDKLVTISSKSGLQAISRVDRQRAINVRANVAPESSQAEAMAELPEEQLEVLRLAYFDGLSHSEIAEVIGIPLGTVKGRVRLALERLRSLSETYDLQAES